MAREHSFEALFHSLLREETNRRLVHIRIIDELLERPEITLCQARKCRARSIRDVMQDLSFPQGTVEHRTGPCPEARHVRLGAHEQLDRDPQGSQDPAAPSPGPC